MNTSTNTPRTDACPHCGDEVCAHPQDDPAWKEYRCGTVYGYYPSDLCHEREKSQKLEAEIERLRKENDEFLISEAALSEELKICDDWLVHTRHENARLKEMVMDSAKRGDKMALHWQERAEKAEAIIKLLHNFAETIEVNHISTDHVTTHVTDHVTQKV